jgi:DNA-binding MarR family transcriptional regulator
MVDSANKGVEAASLVERPHEDTPDDQLRNVIRNLRLAFRIIRNYSRWVESQCGVSATQLWTLKEIAYQPEIRTSNLSRALSLHQSTTSNLLDKLETRGLIRRKRSDTDQREVRITLTDTGHEVLERAPGPGEGLLRDALSSMPAPALHELDRGLVALLQQTPFSDLAEPLSKPEHSTQG